MFVFSSNFTGSCLCLSKKTALENKNTKQNLSLQWMLITLFGPARTWLCSSIYHAMCHYAVPIVSISRTKCLLQGSHWQWPQPLAWRSRASRAWRRPSLRHRYGMRPPAGYYDDFPRHPCKVIGIRHTYSFFSLYQCNSYVLYQYLSPYFFAIPLVQRRIPHNAIVYRLLGSEDCSTDPAFRKYKRRKKSCNGD